MTRLLAACVAALAVALAACGGTAPPAAPPSFGVQGEVVVFAAASLSFVGLGIQPPSPDWGAMVNDTHLYLQTNAWIVLAPTVAIASLVVAINLLADGLRRAARS